MIGDDSSSEVVRSDSDFVLDSMVSAKLFGNCSFVIKVSSNCSAKFFDCCSFVLVLVTTINLYFNTRRCMFCKYARASFILVLSTWACPLRIAEYDISLANVHPVFLTSFLGSLTCFITVNYKPSSIIFV